MGGFRTEISKCGEAGMMNLGSTQIFYSYQTIIAIRIHSVGYRTDLKFTPSTNKHFKELGCDTFIPVPDAKFLQMLKSIIAM